MTETGDLGIGLLSNLFGSSNQADENIPAIMLAGAIDQIRRGILPTMNTNQLMLTNGEVCHFSERAIRVTEKKSKHYERGSKGVSIRIAKGVTYRTGKHKGVPVEDISYVKTKGLLYITSKRIVFVSDGQAFEKKFNTLTACVPYLNAIKLQFGNTTITLTVSDGNAVNMVITMINLGIQ